MYYEEQWVDGALCWRTSPDGAWTRYTANELAHRYESAEKRASDAQATVEALQAQVKQLEHGLTTQADAADMWYDEFLRIRALNASPEINGICDRALDGIPRTVPVVQENHQLRQQVEALRAQLPAEMQECTILFKECEKGHGRLTATNWIDHGCQTCEVEALQREHTQLQALVRVLPVVKGKFEVGSGVFYYVRALDGKENPVVCGLMTEQATAFAIKALLAYRATLDATTPATTKT